MKKGSNQTSHFREVVRRCEIVSIINFLNVSKVFKMDEYYLIKGEIITWIEEEMINRRINKDEDRRFSRLKFFLR